MLIEDNLDQFKIIDVISTAISMYGFLLTTLGSTRNLYYPLPPDTKIGVGFILFFVGWSVLFIRYGFEKKGNRK